MKELLGEELYNQVKNRIKTYKLEYCVKMLGFRNDSAEIVGAFDVYLSTALYK